MAIPVKDKTNPELTSSDDTFEQYYFDGLTTQGRDFLHSLDTDKWYIFDTSLNYYTEIDVTLQDLVNSNQNYNISNFQSEVNVLLESTAVSYGYNSIDNAISYYNSGITAWRNEAIAFNTWRDNTLDLMYDNVYSFTADGITLPTLSGFTGQAGYFDVGLGAPSRPQLFS